MGFGELRRLVLETNRWAHGVPVTIRDTLEQPEIQTTGIWLAYRTEEALEHFVGAGRNQFRSWRDVQRVLAIARSDLDIVPRQTRLLAPEVEGGEVKAWIVDVVVQKCADHTRVIVRPDPAGA